MGLGSDWDHIVISHQGVRAFAGTASSGTEHNAEQIVNQTPFNENFYANDYQRLKERENNNSQPDRPKAYLNFVLFDEDFKMVEGNSGVRQVKQNPDELQHLETENMAIEKSGFLYVYTSNESPQDVFFDNVLLALSSGPLLEQTHYYPYGLVMNGISSNALRGTNYRENRLKFNGNELQSQEFADASGLELYDFNARTYDPQIGRFLRIDPMQEKAANWSGYRFGFDNPVLNSDPTGLWEEGTYDRGDQVFDEIIAALKGKGSVDVNEGDNDKAKAKKKEAFAPVLFPLFTEALTLAGATLASGALRRTSLDLGAWSNGVKAQWRQSLAAELVAYMSYSIDQLNQARADRVHSNTPYYDADLAKNMVAEITKILSKTYSKRGIVYALLANEDGMYNVYLWGFKNPVYQLFLKKNEVWKYGETTSDERYDDDYLEQENVHMVELWKGSQKQIKIMEKFLLYGYYFENGRLPYGNKMFR